MKNEILSASVSSVHRLAGQKLADSYLAQLANTNPCSEAALKFPTLHGMAESFRHELSDAVFTAASARGIRNIKVRHLEIVYSAHYAVKTALKADAAMSRRLLAIRDTQLRVERLTAQREAAAANASGALFFAYATA